MTKTILITIVALAAGLSGGAGLMYWTTAPKLAASASAGDAMARELASVQRQRDELAKHAQALEEKNGDYAAEVSDLESQLAALERASKEPAEETPAEGELSGFDITESLLSNLFHDEEENGEDAKKAEADPAAAAQRRDAQDVRTRDKVQEFLAAQLAAAKNPGVQERLQSLADYTDYMLDLKRRLRQAGTPEEKEAVREEMRAANREMKRLVNEQQRYLLENTAKKCGVPASKQSKFVTEMRDTLQDPFFHVNGQLGKGGNKGKKPGKAAQKAAKS